MDRLKFWRRITLKAAYYLSYLILATAALVSSIYILDTGGKSYAAPQTATIKSTHGTVSLKETINSIGQTFDTPHEAKSSQILTVSGGKSRAHIQYPGNAVLVQAGPDDTTTDYSFFCKFNAGSVVWGVKDIKKNKCEGKDMIVNLPGQPTIRSRPVAPAAVTIPTDILGRTIVSPDKEPTLVYGHNLNGKLAIDVLVGSVTIRSASNPPVPVRAGTRYIYSGDGSRGVTSNIPADVYTSEPVRLFLEPTNWSEDAVTLINEYQAALKNQVRVVSISPLPDTQLQSGQPSTFQVRLGYKLGSADKAILALYMEQFPSNAGGCTGSNHKTNGGTYVPISRGEGEVSVRVSWLGDTGTGYVSPGVNFWPDRNGQLGQPMIQSFGTFPEYCYSFAP